MKFDISGFTDTGTVRPVNQDRILINGNLSDHGRVDLADQDSCICFVADGVGGNKRGDFASEFVLTGIISIESFDDIEERLQTINNQLLSISAPQSELTGTATTLTGLIVTNDFFQIVHVGDSQIWLRRNGTFFKVTNDQVLNEQEANSPLTSYFGGTDTNLKFDTEIFVNEIDVGDLLLICSDGLFKSLNHKKVKAILDEESDLPSQAERILNECRASGADDNVSVILVQQKE